MKFTLKKSVSRSGLTAALSLAFLSVVPSAAHADALAHGFLDVTNFKVTLGQGVVNAVAGGTGNATVTLNGASATTGNLSGSNYNGQVSLGAGYVPDSPILGNVTNTFSGGKTTVIGDATSAAGVRALADSVVSLKPQGDGTSFTNTGSSFGFTFSLDAASTLAFAFDAEMFLRTYLAGTPLLPGSFATSRVTFGITISKSCSDNNVPISGCVIAPNPVFRWDPNGNLQAGGITGGVETLDDFRINDAVSADIGFTEDTRGIQTGKFAATTNLLNIGRYSLIITHKVDSEATVFVPEPSSLALVGVSLLGLAAVGRRRAMRQAA